MIDLKHEIERELSLIDPPDLWDRIHVEASNDGEGAVVDLTPVWHRRRPSRWRAVAAVTVLLALVGALVLLDDHQTVDTTPAADVPVVTEPSTEADGPTTLAKAADMKISDIEGFSGLGGRTLSIDAEEEGGKVTGEFRVGGVVVNIQCADTRTSTGAQLNRRDLILGGEVTDNTDGLATLDGVNVAVGKLLALIIREDDPELGRQRVTLYHPSLWYGDQATAGGCADLVGSVPSNLDGGFFGAVTDGIETG